MIQDSPEDWDEESRRMGDIYRGSFLNIAANAFFTPRGGLFQARNLLSVAPVELNLSWELGNMIRQLFSVFPHTNGLGPAHSAPLSRRA